MWLKRLITKIDIIFYKFQRGWIISNQNRYANPADFQISYFDVVGKIKLCENYLEKTKKNRRK